MLCKRLSALELKQKTTSWHRRSSSALSVAGVPLAPDIQEALLFLPPVERGRDAFKLSQLQKVALEVDWGKQRTGWTNARHEPH